MGTRFELVLGGGDPVALRPVGEAALEEIAACHERFNRFDDASLLSHIHRTAAIRPVPLDSDSFALFADARAVWRGSGGAFDPTVPARAMDALILDPTRRTVALSRPGVTLDLGAIAKGHALDLAARLLREHGVTSAFLHGGTSSALGIGSPPEGTWRVALPDGRTVDLTDAALSVSAVWGENPHPTIDPRTGAALTGSRQVAVIGPSARLADAWSTAILVLGEQPATLGQEWTVHLSGGRNPGPALER
ncbi:MAG: FAD:protein FMN transferase [Gemmatimonadota bacterium]|jgi:thiamine biosynthesis lipoprotein|nr:FAD:protein FMN transferase [Gemmatimonadota bacterium]